MGRKILLSFLRSSLEFLKKTYRLIFSFKGYYGYITGELNDLEVEIYSVCFNLLRKNLV